MIRKVPSVEQRVETGAVQFGDDWPGTFIRGDNAAYYAMCLDALLHGQADVFQRVAVSSLLEDLKGSNLFAARTSVGELFIWKCLCGNRVQTIFDLHINQRPICVKCNIEMERQA